MYENNASSLRHIDWHYDEMIASVHKHTKVVPISSHDCFNKELLSKLFILSILLKRVEFSSFVSLSSTSRSLFDSCLVCT